MSGNAAGRCDFLPGGPCSTLGGRKIISSPSAQLFLLFLLPFCTPANFYCLPCFQAYSVQNCDTTGWYKRLELTMGTRKKEAARKERQGKVGDGMGNVKVKGENFYR